MWINMDYAPYLLVYTVYDMSIRHTHTLQGKMKNKIYGTSQQR